VPAADDEAQAFTKTWHRGSRAVDTRSLPPTPLSLTHTHTPVMYLVILSAMPSVDRLLPK
jgi:hypothetical protein